MPLRSQIRDCVLWIYVPNDIFFPFGERLESKKVTLKMSHLEREAPDWLNVSFLFVQASCLGEWWGAVNQWESSGEDATVIQEKTAHCSWDVREVWPASGRLRLLSPTAHWQVRLSCDTAEPWNWLICSFWAKNIATFILWWLSFKKTAFPGICCTTGCH